MCMKSIAISFMLCCTESCQLNCTLIFCTYFLFATVALLYIVGLSCKCPLYSWGIFGLRYLAMLVNGKYHALVDFEKQLQINGEVINMFSLVHAVHVFSLQIITYWCYKSCLIVNHCNLFVHYSNNARIILFC